MKTRYMSPGSAVLHELVGLQRLERLAEGARNPPHFLARLDRLVDVALLGLARVEVPVDTVLDRHEEGRHRQVRVDRGVDRPVLEPPGALIRSAVVRFWKPQSAKIGAQKPASAKRR